MVALLFPSPSLSFARPVAKLSCLPLQPLPLAQARFLCMLFCARCACPSTVTTSPAISPCRLQLSTVSPTVSLFTMFCLILYSKPNPLHPYALFIHAGGDRADRRALGFRQCP